MKYLLACFLLSFNIMMLSALQVVRPNMQCTFEKRCVHHITGAVSTSDGEVYYQATDRLAFIYSDSKRKVIVNGLRVNEVNARRVRRIYLQKDRSLRERVDLFLGAFSGELSEVDVWGDARVERAKNDSATVIDIENIVNGLYDFRSAQLQYDAKGCLKSIEIVESNGEKITYNFQGYKYLPVADEMFYLR